MVERHLGRRYPGPPAGGHRRGGRLGGDQGRQGLDQGPRRGASDADKSDYAIGVHREQAREARAYEGSLTKRGDGTLFLTGSETWHGTSAVLDGKLSVVGSHASAVDVRGGTLGGSGTVGDSINVNRGVLRPGLTADEAAQITGASGAAGNVLNVGGNATIGKEGRVAVTISGDRDYTSVRAAGNLVLDGELDLDVRGKLTPGTEFTIMSGSSIKGAFHALPENRALNVGGYLFRVSYKNNSVTLTVMHEVPNTGSRP